MKLKAVLGTVALVVTATAGTAAWAQNDDAGQFAERVCASCHGRNGDSISPAFPRLAGQREEYIEVQLRAFHDKTRADPMAQAYMWGMSAELSEAMIEKVAQYYAKQKPVTGKPGDPELMKKGRMIYVVGVPEAKIQPCATCHGKNAEGVGAFPRLAGQHAEYIVKQLVLFKSQIRAELPAITMHGISGPMSFEQMEAVAAYLSSR